LIAGLGRGFRRSSQGLSIAPRKKKFQQSFSESNAFVCGDPWPAAAPIPGGSGGPGRRRGGGERTRSHTVPASLARRPRIRPYAAAMALWADILTGAHRPSEAGRRAALAVSRAVSRAGRLPAITVTARAMHNQCTEAAPRRSGNPAVTDAVPAWPAGRPAHRIRAHRRPAAGSPVAGRHIVSPVSRAPRTSAGCSSDYRGSHRSDGGARDVRIFAKVQGDSP